MKSYINVGQSAQTSYALNLLFIFLYEENSLWNILVCKSKYSNFNLCTPKSSE